MIASIAEWAGWALFVVAGLSFLIAGIGVFRFPDLYSRFAVIGIAAGFGAPLAILGALLHEPSLGNLVRAALAIAIQLVTSTVGTTALLRAALLASDPMTERTIFNELENAEVSQE